MDRVKTKEPLIKFHAAPCIRPDHATHLANTAPRGKLNQRFPKGPRLGGLFLLGSLWFNCPLLARFNLNRTLFGAPPRYPYVLICRAALIGSMAPAAEARDGHAGAR
jgi:hypothetical protein